MENASYICGPNTSIGEFNVSGYISWRHVHAGTEFTVQFLAATEINSRRTKGERVLWEWDCGDLLFFLTTHKEKLRIFLIISYVFLLDLTVRTIEPPMRKETWKELFRSLSNRGQALNCPCVKREYKINDKRKQRNERFKKGGGGRWWRENNRNVMLVEENDTNVMVVVALAGKQ